MYNNFQIRAKNIAIKNEKFEAKIKQLIWIYFWLLIFEGALRKWVVPQLATPLLLVRDPIALVVFYYGIRRNLFVGNAFLNTIILLNVVSFCLTLLIGHGDVATALFGLRIGILHFPTMIIMSLIFTRDDVHKMGRMILILSIPMTLLLIIQFYSPQTAWVNRGVGGNEEGSGFSGALGFFRCSGTFSFTNGLSLYYSLLAGFVFYYLLENSSFINVRLKITSLICLILSIPYSISRALFLQVVIVAIFYAICLSLLKGGVRKLLIFCFGLTTILVVLSWTSFFQESLAVFMTRFESANEIEGGLSNTLWERVILAGMYEAIAGSTELPFFGYGLGMGTHVGAILLKGDGSRYLLTEGEWGRLIGEMGIVLGGGLVFTRIWISFVATFKSFFLVVKGDSLPWMLLGAGTFTIAQGQWSQPTNLGFATIFGGLALAAYNTTKV